MSNEKDTVSSRRTMLQASVLLLTAGLAGTSRAQAKIAQNLVQYQDKPKGEQECDKCMHFEAPNACKVVEGKISPKGWCAAYAAKPA